MNYKMKLTTIGFCVLAMSSCAMIDDSTGVNLTYPAYSSYGDSQLYQQNTLNTINYNYKYNEQSQDVIVPNSYHVGEMHSPMSFQDRDKTWVSNQNPQSYTIELAEGDKAAKVAQVLYKTPKNDRMAQVKYQRDGKDYYRGVYGTYNNVDDAQKALDALPPEIKSGASVKNWGSVQP